MTMTFEKWLKFNMTKQENLDAFRECLWEVPEQIVSMPYNDWDVDEDEANLTPYNNGRRYMVIYLINYLEYLSRNMAWGARYGYDPEKKIFYLADPRQI